MNQISDFISHLSIQNICGIIGSISAIAGLILRRKLANNIYIVLHTQNNDYQQDNLGCMVRIFLYLVLIVSLLLMIPLFFAGNTDFTPSVSGIASPSPTDKDRARLTIQRFYDDINKKNYQAAFSLTKNGLGQSYDTFANKYNVTAHDDIVFDKIQRLSDGRVQIAITIKATEECSTEKRINSYNAIYTLSENKNVFIILNGHYTKFKYPPCT